jgi:hypothetical protein
MRHPLVCSLVAPSRHSCPPKQRACLCRADVESVGTSHSSPADPPGAATQLAQHGATEARPVGAPAGQAAAPLPWRLEASLGSLGLSLVGSTPSSTCIKAECHGVRAAWASGSGAGGSAEVSASWQRLALHTLQPKEAAQPFEFTPLPSGFAAHGFPHSPGSLGSGSAPGRLMPRSQDPPASFRGGVPGGLGLAGAAGTPADQGFAEPVPYLMARFSASSAAASRYYSAGGSDFEDAASELPDGGPAWLGMALGGAPYPRMLGPASRALCLHTQRVL